MAIANPLNTSILPEPAFKSRSLRTRQLLLLPVSLAALLIVWQSAIWIMEYPAFILPSPARVWGRMLIALADGALIRHTAVTLGESLSGFAVGLSFTLYFF